MNSLLSSQVFVRTTLTNQNFCPFRKRYQFSAPQHIHDTCIAEEVLNCWGSIVCNRSCMPTVQPIIFQSEQRSTWSQDKMQAWMKIFDSSTSMESQLDELPRNTLNRTRFADLVHWWSWHSQFKLNKNNYERFDNLLSYPLNFAMRKRKYPFKYRMQK